MGAYNTDHGEWRGDFDTVLVHHLGGFGMLLVNDMLLSKWATVGPFATKPLSLQCSSSP